MRRRLSKKTTLLGLVNSVLLLVMVVKVQAFQPKLLWQKQFKYDIRDINMAEETGDMIVSNTEEIILYDKNGNEVFHWGPRVDRDAGSVDITADGRYIVYTTGWKEKYKYEKKLKEWDNRVHYATRKGKELWNKRWCGYVRISSDGSKLIMNCGAGEGNGFDVFDSKGNLLWRKWEDGWGAITAQFSPEGNYIAVVGDVGKPLLLLQANNGKILWTTTEVEDSIASISKNAEIITTFPYYGGPSHPERTHNGRVYDRNGNVVLEGFGIVSEDGSRIVMFYKNKTSILALPSKDVIKELPIRVPCTPLEYTYRLASFSYDGRILVIIGKKANSPNNIFVLDLTTGKEWEFNTGAEPRIYLNKDGKYLLVVVRKERKILYYQLY